MTTENPYAPAPLSASDERLWATLVHIGGIFFGFLPALIGYLLLKDRGSFTNVEAKEALNFQITAAIGYVAIFIINAILIAVTLGFWGFIAWIFPLALWILSLIFCIQGFLKAKDGNHYRYPFNIRFIK